MSLDVEPSRDHPGFARFADMEGGDGSQWQSCAVANFAHFDPLSEVWDVGDLSFGLRRWDFRFGGFKVYIFFRGCGLWRVSLGGMWVSGIWSVRMLIGVYPCCLVPFLISGYSVCSL